MVIDVPIPKCGGTSFLSSASTIDWRPRSGRLFHASALAKLDEAGCLHGCNDPSASDDLYPHAAKITLIRHPVERVAFFCNHLSGAPI